MTKNQIESILTDLGYEFNREIKMPEVSSLYLVTDNAFYPSDDTRLIFSTEDGAELLLVYRGHELPDKTFVKDKNYPDEIISFECIAGFTMVGSTHQYEPFRISKAV